MNLENAMFRIGTFASKTEIFSLLVLYTYIRYARLPWNTNMTVISEVVYTASEMLQYLHL